MGFLSRLFGGGDDDRDDRSRQPMRRQTSNLTPDEQAIERYRYLLKTAPPETVEQVHAEGFARLTPEQRQMVLEELSTAVPENERATADDPQSLARMATRAEMRQPGTLERTFSGAGNRGAMGGGMGMGFGGMLGSSLLGSIAGVMIGSAIADQFFNDSGYNDGSADGGDGGDGGEGGDAGADAGGAEGDYGAEGGDAGFDGGGDFGGGDFGGGDFGGGEF